MSFAAEEQEEGEEDAEKSKTPAQRKGRGAAKKARKEGGAGAGGGAKASDEYLEAVGKIPEGQTRTYTEVGGWVGVGVRRGGYPDGLWLGSGLGEGNVWCEFAGQGGVIRVEGRRVRGVCAATDFQRLVRLAWAQAERRMACGAGRTSSSVAAGATAASSLSLQPHSQL